MMSVCLAVQILSGWALIWMEMRKGPTALFFSTPIVLTARHAAFALFLSGWLPGIREQERPSVLSALIAMGRCRHIKEASHQLRLIVMQLI
jgi:hypothetical protein